VALMFCTKLSVFVIVVLLVVLVKGVDIKAVQGDLSNDLLCSCSQCDKCSLGSFALVDSQSDFYLFRGPSFIVDNQVDTCRLKCAIQKDGPSDFHLIILSLFEGAYGSDHEALESEIHYYQKNPKDGSLFYFPSNGTYDMPFNSSLPWDNTTKSYLSSYFEEWYPLVERVSLLQSWKTKGCPSQTDRTTPCVVYVHDHSGKDQVAELTAAYYMLENKHSFSVALTWTCQLAGTPASQFIWALQWLCLHTQSDSPEKCEAIPSACQNS